MNNLVTFLKQADIFFQLTPTQLEMVANICQERSFASGETVVDEGANSKDLYIITHGEVEIMVNPALVGKATTFTEIVTIATLRRGQSFGEVALVDEGVRSASVRASQKDTRVLFIARDKLVMLCETYPQLGYRLMSNLAADLAMKIRNADFRFRAHLLYEQNN